MAKKTDILRVKLVADGAGKVKTEILGVDESMDGLGKSAGKLSDRFGVLKSAIGLISVGAFGAFIKGALDAGDQTQKLAIRLGATTEALSQYRHVAKLSGVEFNQFTMGLQRMTRRVAEASNGTGEAIGALNELGISAAKLKRQRPEDQFEILAEALSQVEDQSDRVRLAMKLFDSGGVALLQMMGEGASGLRAMREEADNLGLTLDRAAADKMAAANDAITRMQSSSNAFANELAINLAPEIERTTELLSDTVPKAVAAGVKSLNWFAGQIRTNAEWFAAYRADHISFWELITTAPDEAKGKLKGLRKEYGMGLPSLAVESPKVNRPNRLEMFEGTNQKSSGGSGVAEKTAKISEAQKELNSMLSQGAQLTKSVMTIEEKHSAQMGELFDLYGSGAIEIEAFNRLEEQYGRTLASVGQQQRDELAGRLGSLTEHFMSESELEIMRHDDREMLIEESFQEGLITQQERYTMLEDIESQHQKRMTDIDSQGMSSQEKLWRSGMQGKLQVTSGVLGSLSQLMISENRKMFNIGKAAAISQTIIETYVGAQKAFSALAGIPIIGPALGAAAAAAAILGGMARVSAIRSQTMSSGGGVSTGAPGGVTVGGGLPAETIPSATTSTETSAAVTNRTFSITDIDENAIMSGQAVRNLIDLIAEQQEDGYTLLPT